MTRAVAGPREGYPAVATSVRSGSSSDLNPYWRFKRRSSASRKLFRLRVDHLLAQLRQRLVARRANVRLVPFEYAATSSSDGTATFELISASTICCGVVCNVRGLEREQFLLRDGVERLVHDRQPIAASCRIVPAVSRRAAEDPRRRPTSS